MKARPCGCLWLAALLAACGGVRHAHRADIPAPATVAVLPFGGTAEPSVRDYTRSLVQSRLQERGFAVAESAFVDRVLSERGWLRDPADIDPGRLPMARVRAALGVDAVVVGVGLQESRFNLVLVRRHAFGGSLAFVGGEGAPWWRADHTASTLGGFLLQSGQVFTELRAQGAHGTPLSTLALVDRFVEEAVDTVPAAAVAPRAEHDPLLGGATSTARSNADGTTRVSVEATALPGSALRFDLVPVRTGVPMAELPGSPGTFRGAHDLPAGAAATGIVVRARGPFGRETSLEVKS